MLKSLENRRTIQTMSFKTDLAQLSGLRLLLGGGVGFLFFGIVNLFTNTGLAVGLFIIGITIIMISVIGHRRFGERTINR